MSHIQYAQWLPSGRFSSDPDGAMGVLDAIPPSGTVVIYCVGGDCDASENTAIKLEQFGYTDLRIMGVGFDAWARAGYPISGDDASGDGGSP